MKCSTFMSMKGQKKKKEESPYASVKISRILLELLKTNKEKSGVPISVFIEKAVEEKLNKGN